MVRLAWLKYERRVKITGRRNATDESDVPEVQSKEDPDGWGSRVLLFRAHWFLYEDDSNRLQRIGTNEEGTIRLVGTRYEVRILADQWTTWDRSPDAFTSNTTASR